MGKTKKILLGVGVLLLIGLIAVGVWLYVLVSGLKPTAAHLIVDQGSVELKSGLRWVKVSDSDLVQGDIIRTLAESEATILFFETSFIKLFPNTELEIKEINKAEAQILLKQNSGQSWSEVIRPPEAEGSLAMLTNLLGINSYQIEIPNAVASVRGTSFGLDLTEESRLAVLEGEVDFKTPFAEERIGKGEEARLREGKIIQEILKEDNFIMKAKQAREKNLELIKARLKKKYARLIRLAKEKYSLTEEQLDQGIKDYLEGKLRLKDQAELKKEPERG